MMGDAIAVFGTGGFAREVACLLHDLGRGDEIAAFHEPDDVHTPRTLLDVQVLPQSAFDPSTQQAVVAIGNPRIREKVVGELPRRTEFATLIHPSVVMSRWVEVGVGSILCAGCVLTCQITLGSHCHLNLNTTVGHDCSFGDFCTVAPGVNVSGNCTFGQRVDVGTQASFRQQIRICDDVTVGMGAVVVKDIPEPGTYVGVPAKRVGA
jgi:sugar O-acyltransferase (sialic acid O-acetyltransferase NeuD family)